MGNGQQQPVLVSGRRPRGNHTKCGLAPLLGRRRDRDVTLRLLIVFLLGIIDLSSPSTNSEILL